MFQPCEIKSPRFPDPCEPLGGKGHVFLAFFLLCLAILLNRIKPAFLAAILLLICTEYVPHQCLDSAISLLASLRPNTCCSRCTASNLPLPASWLLHVTCHLPFTSIPVGKPLFLLTSCPPWLYPVLDHISPILPLLLSLFSPISLVMIRDHYFRSFMSSPLS